MTARSQRGFNGKRPRLRGMDWEDLRHAVEAPLFRELCRAFHSKSHAMECALRHGQVTIDGFVIRHEHLARWAPEQLRGRYAVLCGQIAQLFGSRPVDR